jgi:hypothetical protein
MQAGKHFDYTGFFPDKRQAKRCSKIANDMFHRRSAVINQFAPCNSESTAARRFFNNCGISVSDQIQSVTGNICIPDDVQTVLLIEDGSEFDFTSRAGRIKRESLGPLANEKCMGFFFHPCLVVDAEKYTPPGCSAIEIRKREYDQPTKHERNYKYVPIAEKESRYWMSCVEYSRSVLPERLHKIVVADREADIYQLYNLKDDKTDMVVRMRSDRTINNGTTIRYYMTSQQVKKRVVVHVKADKKDNRSKHTALLEIKYGSVEIKRPARVPAGHAPSCLKISVVEIRESAETVVKGQDPIHWLLLTTIDVRNSEMAQTILEYYSKRWMIEEIFGIMKSRSLNLEQSQLTQGNALMKLAVVTMDVAVKILQLTKGRDDEQAEAEIIFSSEEINLIEKLIPGYEGKTEKQKNTFRKKSLAWAAWLIARLGGWKGYKTESPPGNKTMGIGLERFNSMFEAYQLLGRKNVYGD